MWNEPTMEELEKVPRLYSTEPVPCQDKIVHMHFFLGGCDWYGCEYDPDRRIFFGFAILNGNLQNAEWGYFALEELKAVRVGPFEIDRELEWTPCKASQIEKIAEACGWEVEK